MSKQLNFLQSETENEWRKLCADLAERWAKHPGFPPVWTGRDWNALWRIYKRGITAEEIKRRWENYLESPDPFVQARGWGLRYFAENFDGYAFGPINARQSAKEQEARAELNVGRNRNG